MWLPPFPERARADWLARFGLSRVWSDRLQDAQHVLQGVYQKFGLESARADPFCDGYCFWTLVDVVVPLDVGVSGQGWLTPFWDPTSKGLTPNDFAAFNSPDCLVADLPLTNRVFASGDAFRTTIGLARYGNAHLCCQERLWDGIKRDRLVWMGGAHPETMAILNVFGAASVLPETFDYAVAVTDPSRQWMNNVATYLLEAMSAAGEDTRALDTVRDYWGAMLDVGATSFWEDFKISWTNDCFRIDELPVSGKKDIHGDYGEFCYPGFRHSLCHGWSSGPAAWLIGHVLGIRPLEAGCRTVQVRPSLGDLDWAEGAMALPCGEAVRVRVEKDAAGALKVDVCAPQGVRLVRGDTDEGARATSASAPASAATCRDNAQNLHRVRRPTDLV